MGRYLKTGRRASPLAREYAFRPKRGHASRSAVRPEWRLVLIIPNLIAGAVSPGQHGYGVNIIGGENSVVLLEVKTWSAEEAVQRAGDFLYKFGRHLAPFSVEAEMRCADWAEGEKTTRWISIGDIHATRSVARPLALKAQT
jgi:hypothetical protein